MFYWLSFSTVIGVFAVSMFCTDTLIVRNQQASSDERADDDCKNDCGACALVSCHTTSSICWSKELFAVSLGMLIIDVLFLLGEQMETLNLFFNYCGIEDVFIFPTIL